MVYHLISISKYILYTYMHVHVHTLTHKTWNDGICHWSYKGSQPKPHVISRHSQSTHGLKKTLGNCMHSPSCRTMLRTLYLECVPLEPHNFSRTLSSMLAGSTCVHGSTTSDSFSLILQIDWNYSFIMRYCTRYRNRQDRFSILQFLNSVACEFFIICKVVPILLLFGLLVTEYCRTINS